MTLWLLLAQQHDEVNTRFPATCFIRAVHRRSEKQAVAGFHLVMGLPFDEGQLALQEPDEMPIEGV